MPQYSKLFMKSKIYSKILIFRLEILENTTPGTIIAVYLATDFDSENTNSQIVYSLNLLNNKSSKNSFVLDSEYGWLIIGETGLDREIKDFYRLQITATDEGGLKTQQYLNITVLDVNDSPPKFELEEYFEEMNMENIKNPILTFNVTVSLFKLYLNV